MRVPSLRVSVKSVLAAVVLVGINWSQTIGVAAETAASTELAGKWKYRSFHNNPALVTGNDSTALSLFFAEATFTFTVSADDLLAGTIDWNGGGLDLKGTIQAAGTGSPLTVQIVGLRPVPALKLTTGNTTILAIWLTHGQTALAKFQYLWGVF